MAKWQPIAYIRRRAKHLRFVAAQSDKHLDWFELEARFKELEPAFRGARIDAQMGDEGQYWRIAAVRNEDAELRFEALARMAGNRLLRDFPTEVERHRGFDSENDPAIRWYKALALIGQRYNQGPWVELKNNGEVTGYIFTGDIKQPAMASATLCLELASWEKENGTR